MRVGKDSRERPPERRQERRPHPRVREPAAALTAERTRQPAHAIDAVAGNDRPSHGSGVLVGHLDADTAVQLPAVPKRPAPPIDRRVAAPVRRGEERDGRRRAGTAGVPPPPLSGEPPPKGGGGAP